ncbi:hypothetical protein PanWU01x14_318010 [Parasponia andersonii]|uniref:Uncharacterized protein n=1 Tax=Parasponia andersonii TaxID=3476 RepID=A0A2P5AMK0_PARAD|nr:hypothetical protein PanWU01x14_318010 [Parasponia andersonii]
MFDRFILYSPRRVIYWSNKLFVNKSQVRGLSAIRGPAARGFGTELATWRWRQHNTTASRRLSFLGSRQRHGFVGLRSRVVVEATRRSKLLRSWSGARRRSASKLRDSSKLREASMASYEGDRWASIASCRRGIGVHGISHHQLFANLYIYIRLPIQ